MTDTWVATASPTISLATGGNLVQTADGNNLVLVTAPSDTLLQFYDTSDTWGPALDIPVGSLGGGFFLATISPIASGHALIMNGVVTDYPAASIGSLNVTTGAITAYTHPTRNLTTPFAAGSWSFTNTWLWFETLPGLFGQLFTGGVGWLVVMFNITDATLAGVIFANINSAVGEFDLIESGSFVESTGVPPGFIYSTTGGLVPTGAGANITTVLPSTAFSGAGTTTITWTGDGATVTGVPAIAMTSFNSGGFLTPTTLDSFTQSLLTTTLAAQAGVGKTGYTTLAYTTGYPVTFQPFDLTLETLGTPTTLNAPVTPTIDISAMGFNNTAYYLVDATLYKLTAGIITVTPTVNNAVQDIEVFPDVLTSAQINLLLATTLS